VGLSVYRGDIVTDIVRIISAYGEQFQNLLQPALDLLTKDGIPPFMAMALLIVAIVVGIWTYGKHIAIGRVRLNRIEKLLKTIQNPTDFAARYNEIDEGMSSTKPLEHSWQELKETFIFPYTDETNNVIRNTVRPHHYFNSTEIEARFGLRRLHFVSNILIGLGLLLTFAALIAALTEAGHGLGNNGNADDAIKKLLAAAAFKFWTSVAGLFSSIGLRIFYEYQHSKIKRQLGRICAGLERGLQLVTPEFLANEQLREAREQTAAMKRFTTDLAVSLTAALKPVHESIQDIGHRITGGIGDAIKESAGSEMQALAQNLGGIVESLNSSRAEMDKVASTVRDTLTEAAEAMRTAAGSASNEMSQHLKDIMTSLAEENRKQTRAFDEAMQNLSIIMDQAGNAAGGKITQAATSLANGLEGITDGVRHATGTVADRMDHLSNTIQSTEEKMAKHIMAMDSLIDRVRETENSFGATSKVLVEAAIPITRSSENMAASTESLKHSIQGISQIIGDSHKGLASLSGKMEQTQQVLQQAWQAYDKRFGEVDESLGKAMEGIIDNVKINIEKMSEFIREVDQKLSGAVEIFSQSISELNATAEDFEKATTQLHSSVSQLSKENVAY
jgi:prefoldin subunit 5